MMRNLETRRMHITLSRLISPLTLQIASVFQALVYSNKSLEQFIQVILGLFHAAGKKK